MRHRSRRDPGGHDAGGHDPDGHDPGGRPANAWIEPPGAALVSLADASLAAFDVGRLRPGSGYAARYPRQAPCDGARIPALAEVFALAVPAGVRVDAELKTLPLQPALTVAPDVMARAVFGTAERCSARGLLDIRSFDWRGVRASRALDPAVPVTLLTSAETEQAPDMWWGCADGGSAPERIAREWPGSTWAPEFSTVTPGRVSEAHALGLRVVPWTVNDLQDMRTVMDWGCDGLCTDYPDLAFSLLA